MLKEMTKTQGSSAVDTADIVKRGWDAVAAGQWDTLIADYTQDMIFVMPGQNDVLKGRAAFRSALDGLGGLVPAGFAITAIRQIGGGDEVVSVVDWKCDKVPGGSQLSVLFRFEGSKIREERWFIDTEQWKAAF